MATGVPSTVGLASFGERFKAARQEAGLSAPKVAEALHYARAQSVYDIENDRSTPDPERLAEAAELFNVPLLWLATGRDGEGESDRVAKLRHIAAQLNATRQRQLVRFAQVMLEEQNEESTDITEAVEAMMKAGLDRETAERAARSLVALRQPPPSTGRSLEGEQESERRQA